MKGEPGVRILLTGYTMLRRYSHWVQPERADTGFLRLALRS